MYRDLKELYVRSKRKAPPNSPKLPKGTPVEVVGTKKAAEVDKTGKPDLTDKGGVYSIKVGSKVKQYHWDRITPLRLKNGTRVVAYYTNGVARGTIKKFNQKDGTYVAHLDDGRKDEELPITELSVVAS